jgi:hypothetical protein
MVSVNNLQLKHKNLNSLFKILEETALKVFYFFQAPIYPNKRDFIDIIRIFYNYCTLGCSDFHIFFIFLGMSHLPSFPWDPRVQKM